MMEKKKSVTEEKAGKKEMGKFGPPEKVPLTQRNAINRDQGGGRSVGEIKLIITFKKQGRKENLKGGEGR